MRSDNMTAGMEMASMEIAEMPEARKEAVWLGIPAWEKMVGAYYVSVISRNSYLYINERRAGGWITDIEHTINPAKLNHAQHKQRQNRPSTIPPLKHHQEHLRAQRTGHLIVLDV